MEEIQEKTKYCKYCGKQIVEDAVMCVYCGRQVEILKSDNSSSAQPNVIINNTNTNTNTNVNRNDGYGRYGREKNKWVVIITLLFLGFLGGHKFYEGKIGMGILYLFTVGLFGFVSYSLAGCSTERNNYAAERY